LKYFFICIFFIGTLQAGLNKDIQIIASNVCKIDYLDHTSIKDIFLKKSEYLDGDFIIILDNPNNSIYKEFIHNFIHRSLEEVKAYWMRMLFTGKMIPPEKLKPAHLNTYDDKICYISYIKGSISSKKWKNINIR